MGGTGDVAGLAVLQGQAGHGMLGERVAIPQMKRTCPAGSGGEAESVNTEWGGPLRLSHNLTHNCLALYCHQRGPAVEVCWYKYGNDDSMGLASCGQMWSGSRAPVQEIERDVQSLCSVCGALMQLLEREREIWIFPWLQVHIMGPRHHLTSSLQRGMTRLGAIYGMYSMFSSMVF